MQLMIKKHWKIIKILVEIFGSFSGETYERIFGVFFKDIAEMLLFFGEVSEKIILFFQVWKHKNVENRIIGKVFNT